MIYEVILKNKIREYLINANIAMFDTERRNICLIGEGFEVCCFYLEREIFIELIDVCNILGIKNFILSERY